ncbi:alpha/beta hydrolase [Anaerovorax odorimutans]|uniref:Alpha/beta hydrolase n=1 Tax=Anaerovorax odorimutans TaxID=109327 RepID=A0ABT1RQ43_9FIRM|nr:alpha/beta hydrolase [Anaerovorax odorimutans]MCQ4637324.1 alpha/beta hydrolase [Anaerovorax odorimutans]
MDKKQIDSELKQIAIRVPYNKLVIKCANLFQVVSFRLTRIPKGVTNRRITVEGYKNRNFKVEVFEPSNVKEKLPCLIYVHGGAFSYRASAHHKKLACMYAMKARCRVYFPDYHLTPKYSYPAAYEDVLALYKCIMKNSEAFRIDGEKIGVAGDSAGASIAALICNNYERENLKQPCVQMLIYPVTDVSMRTDSMKRFSDTPLWNSKNNKRMWSYYCKNLDVEDTYGASPMHSSLPQTIPDTYIETAEYDCLHDEGVLYGKRLRQAGASVEMNETRGTIHGYDCALNTQIVMGNVQKRILFLNEGFNCF